MTPRAARPRALAIASILLIATLVAAAAGLRGPPAGPAGAAGAPPAAEKGHGSGHGKGKAGEPRGPDAPAQALVAVRVATAGGRPLVGAFVALEGRAGRPTATTDALGLATLRVPGGRHTLVVLVEGQEVHRQEVEARRFLFVDVVVPEGGPGSTPRQPAEPPRAAFTYDPPDPRANETVVFNGSASSDPDGGIANFTWTFGDGTKAFGPVAGHAYAGPGTYGVNLEVRDGDGLRGDATERVTVAPPPPPRAFRLAVGVVTPQGLPVARSRIAILDENLTPLLTASGAGTYNRTLPPGNYTVQAWGEGQEFLGAKGVVLDADRTVVFTQTSATGSPSVPLPPRLLLVVAVLGGLGAAAGGVHLFLRRRGGAPPSPRPPP